MWKNHIEPVCQHFGNEFINHIAKANGPEIRDTTKDFFFGGGGGGLEQYVLH
jgi:hypothetical protein